MSYCIITRSRSYNDWNYYCRNGYAVDTFDDATEYDSKEEAIQLKNELASKWGGEWAVVEGCTDVETGKIYVIYDENLVDEDDEYDASTKKSKMNKSEGITSSEVEDIDRSFEQDGWDVSGWVEPSSKLGFIRPWWIIRDVSLSNFVALQRITESIIPMKFQCGIDYEFADYGNNGVYLEFLIPYVEDYSASTKKSYTPDYLGFRDMVKSIKNTGNHNKVFKE